VLRVCNEILHVHHLSYRNVGSERMEELVTLCERAHRAIHDRSNPLHETIRAGLQPAVLALRG
jgi:5-methylcytosine-specific restriction endonuclease McrA